jgi:hypothetical protein
MKLSTLLTVILILVVAGLCFGQATERVKATNVKVKAQVDKPLVSADAIKFKAGLKPIFLDDGLQCLVSNAEQIKAAYAEAAASGCKKVTISQGTGYNCGFHMASNPALDKCLAAAKKVADIIKNCKLKPPVHNPPVDGWDMNPVTPGCNSLGIFCIEDPS